MSTDRPSPRPRPTRGPEQDEPVRPSPVADPAGRAVGRPSPGPSPALRGPEFETPPAREPVADRAATRTLERPDDRRVDDPGRTASGRRRGPGRIAARRPGAGRPRPRLRRPGRPSKAALVYLVLLALSVLLWVAFSASAGFEYDQGRASGLPVLVMTAPWWLLFLVVNPGQWPGALALLYLLAGGLVNAVLIHRWTRDAAPPGRHPSAWQPPA